ncbi:exonuclease domain-containing protein [Bradyrhizobium retamae]|uniref:exonuclease domain-containing protein n=1 Tax=Bradyrhizobium retamae TaxID=1300035 RepID=UPI00070B3704
MSKVTDFIALDVETANADLGSICSIGLVHFRSGAVFKSLTILVDPEDEFDPLNIGIHGIRPEDVAGKPTMAQVFPAISASLSDVVVVHHSHFDRTARVPSELRLNL